MWEDVLWMCFKTSLWKNITLHTLEVHMQQQQSKTGYQTQNIVKVIDHMTTVSENSKIHRDGIVHCIFQTK